MDSPTLDEMNFLAKRLAQLNDDEVAVLKAIAPRYVSGFEDDIVSIKDLINITYGLQSVSVISGVSSDEQLGEFVIDNDLHGDVESVPHTPDTSSTKKPSAGCNEQPMTAFLLAILMW